MQEGGLKTNNQFKRKGQEGFPLISIITVVYNSENLIEGTIQSVLSQSYPNIEHIIIDGNSKDGTIEILKRYNDKIAYWLSESDQGLYDAMNKGLAKATGDYICFLNSGDKLYDHLTLEKSFAGLNPLPDIVYGETMIVDKDGNEIGLRRLKAPETLTWRSFQDGMVVCHQSIYIKRELAGKYQLKYKIAADFEWVLEALKKAKTIKNSNLILTRFLDGGMNKQNIKNGLFDRFKIMSHYYGFIPTMFRHFIIGTKFFWYWFRNKRF
jgi:glycosyltransferase involved in cell wall biosynthesis